MKKIDISTKKYPNTFALVDDCDYERLNRHKWHPNGPARGLYAVRNITVDINKRRRVRMHREVLGLIKDGFVPDHINGITLDNTSSNLRICTRHQNGMNRSLPSCSTSGYKGVYWHKSCGKWHARIRFNGSRKSLGYYTCLIKAAKAYDDAAVKYYGEFARLNFKRKSHEN